MAALKIKPLIVALGLLISSQAAHALTFGVQDGAVPLNELQSMHYTKGMALAAGHDDLTNKRLESMREAALVVGAQHGYVHSMNVLRKEIDAKADVWDDLFAFKDLMRIATPGESSLYFLPGVVHESAEVTSHSEGNDRIEVSGKYYEIVKKERLVTNPPDWREYLLIDIPADISKPVGALLPKTASEQQLWSDWISEGWEAGVLQAHAEMTARQRQLGSDFIGMVRFVRLVEQGDLKSSFVASQTRDRLTRGKSMHVNQRTFAITSQARFSNDHNDWVPLDLDPRAGYRSPDEVREINQGVRQ
jgi:defect-in-organelle-trafficking protein DotC